MKVIVGCEFSGVVRRAFRKLGHDAYSCDLLPADDGEKNYHYQDDILNVLKNNKFDLGIFHPPCTYLCNSGVSHLYKPGSKIRDNERWSELIKGANFFKTLLNSDISRVAVENPIMHIYALSIIGIGQTQIIQPWMFGHGETKATCLWLRNLPPLKPTNIVTGREQRVHKESPGKNRWKKRSITYTGIAEAMASQWGKL